MNNNPLNTSDLPSNEEVYRAVIKKGFAQEEFDFPDVSLLRVIFDYLWSNGRIEESLACLRLIERITELNTKEFNLIGFALLLKGKSKEALASFENAAKLPDVDDFTFIGKAYAFFYLEDYGLAYELFQQLIDRGTKLTSPAHMAPVCKAMLEGRTPESFMTPPLPGMPLFIVSTLYQKQMTSNTNALSLAIESLRDAPREHYLPLLRLIMELFVELDKCEEGLTFLYSLPQEERIDGMIVLQEAFALRRLEENDYSHQAFEFASFLSPLHPRAWGGYAAGLSERGETADAIRAYEKAIFLDPQHVSFVKDLGSLYAELREYERAIPYLTRAIDLGSQAYQNYLNRGICFLETGKINLAKADFEYSIFIEPNQKQAKELIEYIADFGDDAFDDRFVFGTPEE